MPPTATSPCDYPEVDQALGSLLAAYRRSHPHQAEDLITRAFKQADRAHDQQRRLSGELYIHHPVAVAHTLAEMGFDDVVLAAALAT